MIYLTVFFDATSRRHNDIILTSFGVYLFTLPVNIVYVKLWGLTHVATAEQLRQERPDFIAPNLWPPNRTDLNPVNYEIWAVMQLQRRVYTRDIAIV